MTQTGGAGRRITGWARAPMRSRLVAVTALCLIGAGSLLLSAPAGSAATTVNFARVDASVLGADAPSTGPVSTTRRYGALPGTSLAYPVPAGAHFVAPSGSDTATGTKAAPWRTVQYAANAAPAGSTVVLRGGTYHESVTFPYQKPLKLQPFPGEQVIFDGSIPVTNWVADSSTVWRFDGWTVDFPEGGRPDLTTSKYPLAAYPEMVFYDGRQLRQVASRGRVAAGTFFADQAADKLYIGSSPSGHAVAAATLDRALMIQSGGGSAVRGIRFQRYATHPDLYATVVGAANELTFENDEFLDNASVGLLVRGNAAKVVNSTAARNGEMGVSSYQSDGLLVSGNWLHHNNLQNFLLTASQGGLKVSEGTNQKWTTNLAEDNKGDGLWCDLRCNNVTIVNNVVRRNTFRGLKYEISANGIIAGNLATDNATYGILANESANVQIWNNTSVRNQRDIEVTEGFRTSSDPTFPFDVRNVTIRNNLMSYGKGAGTVALFALEDYTKTSNGAQMMVSLDYDGYHRLSATNPTLLAVWANYPAGSLLSGSIAAFRNNTGQEAHGIGVDATVDPFFVNATSNDFRLKSTSVARGAGTPLPVEIAQALGVSAGVPIDLGMVNP